MLRISGKENDTENITQLCISCYALTFSTQSKSTFSGKTEKLEQAQQRATGIKKMNISAQKVANQSRTLQSYSLTFPVQRSAVTDCVRVCSLLKKIEACWSKQDTFPWEITDRLPAAIFAFPWGGKRQRRACSSPSPQILTVLLGNTHKVQVEFYKQVYETNSSRKAKLNW